MNYSFKLFLPVAATAMMLGQVTTAQADQNKGGKGGSGNRGGGSAQVHSGGGGYHGTASRSTVHNQSVTSHNTAYHRSSATVTRSNATRSTAARSTTATSRTSIARTSNGTAAVHGNRSLALTTNGANNAGFHTQARVSAGIGGSNPRTTIANNRFAYRSGNFQPGWNTSQTYYWHNCNWHCYNGVWGVVGIGWPFDWYTYPYPFWYNNWLYYAGDAYQPGLDTSSSAVGGGASIVANVQQDLSSQGYNPGPPDGLMGPMTSNAIAAYQKDHGLPPTGQINGALLNSLGL